MTFMKELNRCQFGASAAALASDIPVGGYSDSPSFYLGPSVPCKINIAQILLSRHATAVKLAKRNIELLKSKRAKLAAVRKAGFRVIPKRKKSKAAMALYRATFRNELAKLIEKTEATRAINAVLGSKVGLITKPWRPRKWK